MATINNVGDWWAAVDGAWGDLTDIVAHHMDVFHPAYEVPGDAKSPPTGRDIGDELTHLKTTRDRRLARYFAAACYQFRVLRLCLSERTHQDRNEQIAS